MSLSKIEKSIQVLQFNMKSRRERVDQVSRRLSLTEEQKIWMGEETQMLKHTEALIKAVQHDVSKILGKIPPVAHDLEEVVLGAVLLHRNGMVDVADFLLPAHFDLKQHQLIYEACLLLFNDGRPIDMRTAVNELRKMGKLEAAGGASKIAELTSKVSSAANTEYHARIMMEFSMKRAIINVSGKMLTDGYDDTKDVFELMDEWEDELKKIKSWLKPKQVGPFINPL